MTFTARTLGLTAALSLATITAPAYAEGIEDWLRDTFSTDDFVGDWLRDVFGPVQNNGEDFDSPSIQSKGYREAVEIMAKWPKEEGGQKRKMAEVAQICDGDKLLHVILETKSPKSVKSKCFK